MANYDAKQIQTLLNKQGYNLAVDGIIGSKTTAAIKDYQQKNGLSVDGIVGPNTWAKLSGSNTGTTTQKAAATTPASFTYSPSATTKKAETQKNTDVDALRNYGTFTPEQWGGSSQANTLYDQALNMQKPTWDGGQWGQGMVDSLNAYLNRGDFSYDLNGDALYQQYKDKYIQQGKMAMMDTMGQAAALTGGYGNSYASTAGNQAYQAQLQNLNDIVPELYQMAYDRYNQKGQDMLNAYNLYKNQYDTEYGQYRDSVGDFYNENDRLWGMANDIYNREYGEYMDSQDMAYKTWQTGYDKLADLAGLSTDAYNNERTFDYGSQQDAYSSRVDSQERAKSDVYAAIQSGVMPSDSLLAQAGLDKATVQAMANVYKKELSGTVSSSSGSQGSDSGNTGSYDNTGNTGSNPYNLSKDKIKEIQKRNGLVVDGIWGPKTQAAYEAEQQGGNVTPSETAEANKFIAMHQTKDEFMRRGKSYKEYKSYIEKALGEADLSAGEYAYLEDYYGL